MKKILILMSCAALLFCGCKDDEDNQAKVSREYQTRIGNKVGLRLFGNLTYSKNKIVFRDEPAMQYAYQKSEGTRYGEFYGYIAEGYFQSEEEIKKSPRQMRELAPGDIKYKDLNDDGVIDANDQCYLGKSWFPSWSYGMGFNINYHNFDLALFFQGVSDVSIWPMVVLLIPATVTGEQVESVLYLSPAWD